MLGSIVLAGVMLLGAAAVGVTARRHRADAIPPNSVVGVRIAATSTSPEAWYAGQRAAVPLLWGVTAALAAGGLGVLVTPFSIGAVIAHVVTIVGVALATASIFVARNAALRADHRARRRRGD